MQRRPQKFFSGEGGQVTYPSSTWSIKSSQLQSSFCYEAWIKSQYDSVQKMLQLCGMLNKLMQFKYEAQSWTALFRAFSSHRQPSASLTKLFPSWTRRKSLWFPRSRPRRTSNLSAIQVCYGRGTEGKAPAAGQFSQFCGKNNHFNVIWITFRTFLRPLERIKLLRLRMYFKSVNYAALAALQYICRSSSKHA